MVKALLAMLVGLWLAGIGTDLFSQTSRFTFGPHGAPRRASTSWWWRSACSRSARCSPTWRRARRASCCRCRKGLRNLLPTLQDLKDSRFAFANGSVVGFLIGVLPGAGSTIASFISYGIEKAVSRRPEEFGKGVVEGVAAPEGANNAETGGALIPMLTLGIPGSSTTAMLLAALVLWGFKPGPLFIPENPALFWGLVASMYIGNVMLLVLNLPLVPLFAQVLRAAGVRALPADPRHLDGRGLQHLGQPVRRLAAGAASASLGYLMRKLDYPSAPLILGLVLGRRDGARAAPVADDVGRQPFDPGV